MTKNKGSYAEVNGPEMYHGIRGTGGPLVLLHGAYMSIDRYLTQTILENEVGNK